MPSISLASAGELLKLDVDYLTKKSTISKTKLSCVSMFYTQIYLSIIVLTACLFLLLVL